MTRLSPQIDAEFPADSFIKEDIGTYIRFPWKTKLGQIDILVTAELRQIYYNGSETVLDLVGIGHEYGEPEQFSFKEGATVDIVDPNNIF
ncbi:hypothetical protein SEA_WEASELS2_36 [Rhodococcus phage Weasels2]|uniref:Uncharacterized protein n=1 Tax=Rhodococcus phage Weasels2 TaxID=1897437 RepID=A0A1I9SA20_9CAUD|nr:hypothetical protein FDH04_gp036 [Rhodococcus phage Weasels2]AOZ63626.1 hypothetical protein SEA_WEASELS2_36 [Rhodococcus phage Weasels2]